MSPNTAQTAVREEHGGDAGAMRRQHESLQVEASDGMRSHQEAVAVRAMAVAMTTAAGSPGREPALAMGPQGGLQFPEGAEQHALFHQGPDVEAHGMAASWGGGSPATGRVLPIWMQRLGAFFHEMRASQTTGAPPWMPSPFPSTPGECQWKANVRVAEYGPGASCYATLVFEGAARSGQTDGTKERHCFMAQVRVRDAEKQVVAGALQKPSKKR